MGGLDGNLRLWNWIAQFQILPKTLFFIFECIYKCWPWLIWRPQIPSLIYFIIIIVIVMPGILAWINTIKKERKYTFYICVWWGKIFCCNSCLSKIFNTLSECNVILPPQLTCSIQMSIHFNSWKEQKTLKYVNIYMEGESKFFLSW